MLPPGFTLGRPQGFNTDPINPDAHPHQITSRLVNAVHGAIRLHPHPVAKNTYGKILAQLLGEQARAHAAGPVQVGSAQGGAQTAEDTGYGDGQVLGRTVAPGPLMGLDGGQGSSPVAQVLALLGHRPTAPMARHWNGLGG